MITDSLEWALSILLYKHPLNMAGYSAKVLAHGMAGGIMSSLNGQKFGNGFASAGVTQAFSGAIDKMDPQNPVGVRMSASRVVAAAAVGGTTSVIAGGKFANGAITGAFSRAFNDESLKQRGDGRAKAEEHVLPEADRIASAMDGKYAVYGNGECVDLLKELLDAPYAGSWQEGRALVADMDLVEGTAIATFQDGVYKGHAAIFLRFDPAGIVVFDQNVRLTSPQVRLIPWVSTTPAALRNPVSNMAKYFSTVKW